ncbi:MAG: type II secretion system F family protein [Patescibacteria group bacterium]
MIFSYKGIDKAGEQKKGTVEAPDIDFGISILQRQGITLSSILPVEERNSIAAFAFLHRVSTKDIVILSRQMATLFQAKVPALRIFKLLADQSDNAVLRDTMDAVVKDLQGGSSISKALARHQRIFSNFYVSMVRAGEESGRLDGVFLYLADYLDRNYAISSKAKNALVYPAFVIFVFIAVMTLMLTVIIPKIAVVFIDSGKELPIYTKIVLGLSDFFVHYGLFFVAALAIGAVFLVRYLRTPEGAYSFDTFKLKIPYIGFLYRMLYLSRISDNMNTMLISGIPMLRAIEITGDVVGSPVYQEILMKRLEQVKGGLVFSASLAPYSEIPAIMVQMIKVGEESGELGSILKTLSKFYQREVLNAVDTLVSLIEPLMMVVLGLGVGILLAAVLLPIYDVASGV